MDKKIAVIGGSGFIGSHTVDELIKNGHKPIVIDRERPTQRDLYWSKEAKMPRPIVEFRYADITDLEQASLALEGVDIVYMLAAISDAGSIKENPEEGIAVNITGLTNVLLACVKNKIKRIIFSSSVWVYSSAKDSHIKVDERTLIPSNRDSHIYTSSKIVGENLIRSFKEMYDLDYTILRYGVAYGPGANESTAISSFTKNALQGTPIIIKGDGLSARSFLYVKDHARGNVLALNKSAKNETINLDGRRKITIKEVAEEVSSLADASVDIVYDNSVKSEYQGKEVSIKKAKKILGWEPQTSFKDGLKKHYEWQSSNYSSSC